MIKEAIAKQVEKLNKEVEIYTQLKSFDTFDMKTQLNIIVNSPLREDRFFLESWTKNLLINKDYEEIEITWNDIRIIYKNATIRIQTHTTGNPILISTKKNILVWKPCAPIDEEYREEITKLFEEEKNLKTFHKFNAIRKKYDRVTFSDWEGNPIFHRKEKKLQYLERELEAFKHFLREEELRYEKMKLGIAENEQIEKDRAEFLSAMQKDFKNWTNNGFKILVQQTL